MYTLYGAESSLFSGKVRAYLRFKGIPFEEQPPTWKNLIQKIRPKTGLLIVPVLETPNEYVQDSTDIIDYCESRHGGPQIYPTTPLQKFVSVLFEAYADEWLLLPAMHYRWHKWQNIPFIIHEFGKEATPQLPSAMQYMTGLSYAAVFSSSVSPILGVSRKMRQAVEQRWLEFLHQFDSHLEQHQYLLGDQPSIGDFGLIGPLYAHLFRDPVPGKIMKTQAPRVADWVVRTINGQAPRGEFVPQDEIPKTLDPMIEVMVREYFPVISKTLRKTIQFARKRKVTQLPRFIDRMRFRVGDVEGKRMVAPYCLWMFQRVWDAYVACGPEGQTLLQDRFGHEPSFQILNQRPPFRIARRGNCIEICNQEQLES